MKARTVVLTITVDECTMPVKDLRAARGAGLFSADNDWMCDIVFTEAPRIDVIQPKKAKKK